MSISFFARVLILLYVLFICEFFFFKQKTAYEMRISDWSSDVCSSDLLAVQIADFDPVVVDDRQRADAHRGEIGDRRTADTARADDRDMARLQLRLPRAAELRQHDLAGIAGEFGAGEHASRLAGASSSPRASRTRRARRRRIGREHVS